MENQKRFFTRLDRKVGEKVYNSENDESNEDDDDDVENDNELTREKVVTKAKEVDEGGNLSDAERRNMREEIKAAKGLEAKNEVVEKYKGIAEENQKKREDEGLEL